MPLTNTELRERLRDNIIWIVARSAIPVSGNYLRKKVGYYLRKLKFSELDFMLFLEKMEDNQEIIKLIKNMKVHYELLNKDKGLAILAEKRSSQLQKEQMQSRDVLILQQAAVQLVKDRDAANRVAQMAEKARTSSNIPSFREKLEQREPQKEILKGDPSGFGVKTPAKTL